MNCLDQCLVKRRTHKDDPPVKYNMDTPPTKNGGIWKMLFLFSNGWFFRFHMKFWGFLYVFSSISRSHVGFLTLPLGFLGWVLPILQISLRFHTHFTPQFKGLVSFMALHRQLDPFRRWLSGFFVNGKMASFKGDRCQNTQFLRIKQKLLEGTFKTLIQHFLQREAVKKDFEPSLMNASFRICSKLSMAAGKSTWKHISCK